MPVRKGLATLYDAKDHLMERFERQACERKATADTIVPLYRTVSLSSCERLWLAVIEQAVFDAHLHTTGGNYYSVVWVRDARKYFDTDEFDWVCQQLGIDPDWARRMVKGVEDLARELRGDEYEEAAIVKFRQGRLRPYNPDQRELF